MSTSAAAVPEMVDAGEIAYVAGLREFFALHRLPFGQPEDLVALTARISEEDALREETGSRLRAIVHSEGEHLSRGELMRLMVVAGGGPTVSPNTPELQPALWQIARWVNTAFEQGGAAPSKGAEVAPVSPVSPGEVTPVPVAFAAPEEVLLSPASIPALPDSQTGAETSEISPAQPAPKRAWPRLRAPGRAVRDRSVPAGDASARRPFRWGSQRNGWILPALIFLAAAGVLAYLVWPASPHRVVAQPGGNTGGTVRTAKPSTSATTAPAGDTAATALRMCAGPIRAGVSRAGIEERSLWAHKLLEQKLYPVAFTQLRGLEAVNPGYPGVALDESEALLQMGQLDGARAAIDAQVKTSACLARLPDAAVDAYCREEFPSANVGACRPAMAQMQAAAELQAAVVHLHLANQMHPDERALAALADLEKKDAGVAHQEPLRPVSTHNPSR